MIPSPPPSPTPETRREGFGQAPAQVTGQALHDAFLTFLRGPGRVPSYEWTALPGFMRDAWNYVAAVARGER